MLRSSWGRDRHGGVLPSTGPWWVAATDGRTRAWAAPPRTPCLR
ncbi:hypothetical protein FM103_04840 [Corynebacterium xerosis]|nr:hypothetical protein FM103_04840 [Corynebacterium xerosis]